MLLHGKGLAGQQGLVDEEILGLHQPPIRRDQIARSQQHEIARDQGLGLDRDLAAVAQHPLHQGDRGPEAIGSLLGPVFLQAVEDDAQQDDHGDDDEAGDSPP
jgi:hypothetical protein